MFSNTYQEVQIFDKHNVDRNFQAHVHDQDLFGDLDVVRDYGLCAPPDGFTFHGGAVRAEDLVSVFNILRCDRAIYYHVVTRHVGKVLLRRVPHQSQGVPHGLGPLVLPTGESFSILCHRVDAVHSVVIIEAIRRHIKKPLTLFPLFVCIIDGGFVGTQDITHIDSYIEGMFPS